MKYLIQSNDIVAEKAKDADYERVVLDTTDSSVYALGVSDYVDLGLPSGTKWMKYNIGASKETDYGLYFQWGDTVGYSGDDAKAHSYWSTYPGNGGASSYSPTAIATWDAANLTNGVLNASVDAVYQATNGKAKMPTIAQIEELTANTTSVWTTIDGVNGRKFTSNSDSSKYVFFPASGSFYNGSQYNLGSGGYYWSSSVSPSNSRDAKYLYFNSSRVSADYYYRDDARSVRGVLA